MCLKNWKLILALIVDWLPICVGTFYHMITVKIAIVHVGNNIVPQSFYYGKQLIIIQLFVDQYNNAQWVYEKGFRIKLEPFKCTKKHFAKAIQTKINENQLKEKSRQRGYQDFHREMAHQPILMKFGMGIGGH